MDQELRWPLAARLLTALLIGGAVLFLFVWSSNHNPFFFISLSELFAIIIAFGTFMVVWNGRGFIQNTGILWIGVTYLSVGVLDLTHLFATPAMTVFPGADTYDATLFWLAARFIQALALLLTPIVTRRRSFHLPGVIGAFLLLTIAFVALGTFWDISNDSYLFSTMATVSGIVIALIILTGLALMIVFRRSIDPRIQTWLGGSMGLLAASVFLQTGAHFSANTVSLGSSLLLVASFFMTYKAVVETGLTKPYETLFGDLNQARTDLQRETDFISAILDTTSALIVVINDRLRITQINRTAEAIGGPLTRDLQNLPAWETPFFSKNPEQARDAFAASQNEKDAEVYDSTVVDQEQQERHISWSINWLAGPDTQDGYIVCTGIDMTEHKQTENELRFVSTHDVLTGLYNRSYFEAEIVRLAETDHFPSSIVIADVDGLKMINDTFGHVVGDVWLQRAANALRSAFRQHDIVARIGGDEFAVLLVDADEKVAARAKRRVEEILAAHNLQNPGYKISISIGCATAEAGYMLMETFKKADQAMYREKSTRKNHVRRPRRVSRR